MGRSRVIHCSVLVLSLAALAGCGGSTGNRPAVRASPAVFLPSTAAALSPALYMSLTSSSSLFAIRASQLAAERSTDAHTRSAAQAIIRDQTGVASQLSLAGRRVDLLPSATLPSDLDAELERLRMSTDFDSDYRRSVGGALSRSFEAHRAFAQGGSSPTLRPVAKMAAPVTKKNLDSLKR